MHKSTDEVSFCILSHARSWIRAIAAVDMFATYSHSPKNLTLQLSQKSSISASTTPQRPIWNTSGTVAVRDFWENGCAGRISSNDLAPAGSSTAPRQHPLPRPPLGPRARPPERVRGCHACASKGLAQRLSPSLRRLRSGDALNVVSAFMVAPPAQPPSPRKRRAERLGRPAARGGVACPPPPAHPPPAHPPDGSRPPLFQHNAARVA